MKILVLSDSHSAIAFMRSCVDAVRPDALIHLGYYFDDGQVLAEEYPGIPIYQVPGNCDRYRCPMDVQEIRIEPVLGVPLYMTHGHRHNVKLSTARLIRDARESRSAAVLYGHTHMAECRQEPDGMWVLNPGSCGYFGGSAGLIEVSGGMIVCCRILRQSDLEDEK